MQQKQCLPDASNLIYKDALAAAHWVCGIWRGMRCQSKPDLEVVLSEDSLDGQWRSLSMQINALLHQTDHSLAL